MLLTYRDRPSQTVVTHVPLLVGRRLGRRVRLALRRVRRVALRARRVGVGVARRVGGAPRGVARGARPEAEGAAEAEGDAVGQQAQRGALRVALDLLERGVLRCRYMYTVL